MINYRIAVVYGSVFSEHTQNILAGISKYAYANSISLYEFQEETLNLADSSFSYQHAAFVSHITEEKIDAVLFLATTFFNDASKEAIIGRIKKFKSIPTVCYGLELANIASVTSEYKDAIDTLVKHILKKHKKKNFAILTGKNSSAEIANRLTLYKESLCTNNIKDIPIFEADSMLYSRDCCKKIFSHYGNEKKNFDFDVLLCMDDEIAYAAYEYFTSLHIRIPEEILICGFDNSESAEHTFPLLTTIDQRSDEMGKISLQTAVKLCKGEKVKSTKIPATIKYRQSYGCISKDLDTPTEENIKILKDAAILTNPENYFKRKLSLHYLGIFLEAQYQLEDTDSIVHELDNTFNAFDIQEYAVCQYTEPAIHKKNEHFIFPTTANIIFGRSPATGLINDIQYSFNPQKNILPEAMKTKALRHYFIFPLFQQEYQHGYLCCHIKNTINRFDFSIFIRSITKVLMASILYRRQQKLADWLRIEKQSLETLSRTDSMTNLLNRRGFFYFGTNTLKMALERNSRGLVVFCDMDGLKIINDNYGHAAGDRAIVAEANLLVETFRSSDIIARLGGDEFAIIAIGMNLNMKSELQNKLEKLSDAYNESSGEPFTLSLSMGAAEFYPGHSDLADLLKEADLAQYKQKRSKRKDNWKHFSGIF